MLQKAQVLRARVADDINRIAPIVTTPRISIWHFTDGKIQAELDKKVEVVVAPVVAPAIDEVDLNTIDVKQIASLEIITLKAKEEKDMTEYVKAIDALLYPLPPVEKPKRKLKINKDKVLTCNPEQINFVV